MYRVSSLGRPLDPSYRSNLHVIYASAAAGLIVAVFNWVAAAPLETTPVGTAASVFLAWAIARELDPDRTAVAGLAMSIAFMSVLIGPAELMLGAGVLAATRVISGTVGASLRGLDLLALVGLAALFGAGGITVVVVPGLLVAAIVGAVNRKQGWLLAAGILLASFAGAVIVSPSIVWSIRPWVGLIMLVIVLGVVAIRIPVGRIEAQSDLGGTLSPRRIAAARLAAAGTVGVAFLVGGAAGVVAAFPTAGAAVVASGAIGLDNRGSSASAKEYEEVLLDD